MNAKERIESLARGLARLRAVGSAGLRRYVYLAIGMLGLSLVCESVAELSPPTTQAATGVGINAFTVNWLQVADATGYELDVSTSDSFVEAGVAATVVGWNFNADVLVATDGLEENEGRELSSTAGGTIGFINRSTGNRAASVNGWDGGAGSKYWLVEFSTVGVVDIRVGWIQRSSDTGPRDFKLQYKIGASGAWIDVDGATVTVANNYTTGVLSNVALPADCNDRPAVQLRWIMTGNARAVGDGEVGSTGTSAIDDIMINGTLFTPLFVSGYAAREIAGGEATSVAVTGLVSSTTYYYRVRAVNATSISVNSGVGEVETFPMPSPVIQEPANITSGTFDAYWSPVTAATGYRLDVARDEEFTDYASGYADRVVGDVASHTVTGLHANVTYYYRVRAYDAGSASANSGTQSATTTTKPEPTNHATAFEASTVTHRTIVLNWTDAVGGILPDGYLVRGSINGFDDIPAPIDGVNVPNSTTWSGGLYANKINHGAQADILTQLQPEQTYYFKLFPYANQFSTIDYKVDGDVPQLMITTAAAPFEDMEGVFLPSYTNAIVTLNSGEWSFSDAMMGFSANDKRKDQRAARIRNLGAIAMLFDAADIGVISLKHADFSSDTGGRFVVEASTDEGVSWFQLGSEIECGPVLQTATLRLLQPLPSGRLRIRKTTAAEDASRINIDNVRIAPLPDDRGTVFFFR